ncbi:MAG: YceI family protein [Rhodobacteraceae bacterium]|nr:YceI family protein [Paracoccaceae bacterium]
MKLKQLATAATLATLSFSQAQAADYVIDTQGYHASVMFRVNHLGYSWLTGRFDNFNGSFTYDADAPEKSSVKVEIDTTSVNSNHAERDNHLRSADFLDTGKFPTASFVSKSMAVTGETAVITGDLTLHGVTKEITIDAELIGEGKDPWGGYRAGFIGTTSLPMADYGMVFNLGPASTNVEMTLNIEGVRQ